MPPQTPFNAPRLSRVRLILLSLAIAIPFVIVSQVLFGDFSLGRMFESVVVGAIYSLCLGGLFVLVVPAVQDRLAAAWYPRDWLMFLGIFTVLIGLGATAASFVLYAVGFVPGRISWEELLLINRLAVGLTMLFAGFSFLYGRMKARLRERNLELRKDLERESRTARARQRELEQAREIQEALLPKHLPRIDGFSLHGAWQPARTVSGDYFDVLQFEDRTIGLCIGDVVGKGISAALLMSNLQAAIHAFASPGMQPADLCKEVNRVITNHVAAGRFITFFYGLLDPSTRHLSYCCAGHNPPIVVRRAGSVLRLETGGTVLGAFPDRRYEQGELVTEPGDRVLLFTDGVTEARNAADEEFGDDRLISLVRERRTLGAKQMTDEILTAVTGFGAGNLNDDATLLALSVH